MRRFFLLLLTCGALVLTVADAKGLDGPGSPAQSGITLVSESFAYREREAFGSAARALARLTLNLASESLVSLHADTSAASAGAGSVTFSMALSTGSPPTNLARLQWPQSGRFVTVPGARQWVPCGTSTMVRLPAGVHEIYWSVGDVRGGRVVFDAGSLTALVVPLGSVSPGASKPARKLALLVGIDDYRSLSVPDLHGCVADVRDMEDLLFHTLGFNAEDIVVLTDRDATRANILRAIDDQLIGRAEPDTLALFYYSGHGSWMPDRDGDEEFDETLVPHDSRTPGHFDISDDEINDRLQSLSSRAAHVVFVFDSCHSGGANKMIDEHLIEKSPGGVPKSIPTDTRQPPPMPKGLKQISGIGEPSGEDYTFISACRDIELAYEMTDPNTGGRRGTFTWVLTREIRRSRDTAITYRELMDRVRPQVQAIRRRQTPQLVGERGDELIFRLGPELERPSVLARAVAGRVILEAGWNRGVTPESVYDIYRPNDRQMDDPSRAIARVEVTRVDLFSSEARFLSGGVFPFSARAVERQRAAGHTAFPLLVDVDGSSRNDAVRGSALVGRLLANLPRDEWFRRRFPVTKDPGDARFFLAEVTDGLALSDGSRELEIFAKTTPAPDLILQLREKLFYWAKWSGLIMLENPNSAIDVAFRAEGARQAGARDARIASEKVFADGAPIELSVTNRSEEPFYFTILDLAANGSVDIVYSHSGVLEPAETWTRSTIVHALPDQRREGSQEVLKLIATQQPADFSFLVQNPQSPLRSAEQRPRAANNFAADLLQGAVLPVKRGESALVETDEWNTSSVVYDIVSN